MDDVNGSVTGFEWFPKFKFRYDWLTRKMLPRLSFTRRAGLLDFVRALSSACRISLRQASLRAVKQRFIAWSSERLKRFAA